jgi:hypothetical protein
VCYGGADEGTASKAWVCYGGAEEGAASKAWVCYGGADEGTASKAWVHSKHFKACVCAEGHVPNGLLQQRASKPWHGPARDHWPWWTGPRAPALIDSEDAQLSLPSVTRTPWARAPCAVLPLIASAPAWPASAPALPLPAKPASLPTGRPMTPSSRQQSYPEE